MCLSCFIGSLSGRVFKLPVFKFEAVRMEAELRLLTIPIDRMVAFDFILDFIKLSEFYLLALFMVTLSLGLLANDRFILAKFLLLRGS